mmetsp:Transcript_1290/g.2586  ORF Transcript_1290/g.2586 Transcript_1290/m.2586 type:complete len:271 (-) Transcript_1290:478-1290(-)
MIVVQYLLGASEVLFHARLHTPRNGEHPVEVVAHNRGLGAHRGHVLELFQLGVRLFARLFRKLGVLDALGQLGHFAFTLVTIAQLALDRLHLLIEVILTLRPLHLGLHAGLDFLLDLQDRHLALHEAVNLLQPRRDFKGLEKLLLLLDLNAQMPRNQISQFGRVMSFGNAGERLFRNVFLDLRIALEFFRNRTGQRGNRFKITGGFRQLGCRSLEERLGRSEFIDGHTTAALDQHFHGAIGKLEQLQHIGQHAVGVNIFGARVILCGIAL